MEIPNSNPLGGDMDGMDDMNNAPMGADDMGMDDPMGGSDPNAMGGEAPMDGSMGGQDPMGADPSAMGGDDDELMNIVNGMSTEDKAAVIKYAKSMADDSEDGEMPQDDPNAMPMESRRTFKSIIDETINDVLDNREGTKRLEKGMNNPFKSPF